jgi:hypothetical protein
MRCAAFAIRFQFYACALIAIEFAAPMGTGVFAQSGAPATIPDAIPRPGRPGQNRDIDNRVNALIRRMTLAEKIGQLQQANSPFLAKRPSPGLDATSRPRACGVFCEHFRPHSSHRVGPRRRSPFFDAGIVGLLTHFSSGIRSTVSAVRFDEFMEHPEGYRKTGAGLLAALPRLRRRWASHEVRLTVLKTTDVTAVCS